MIGVFLILLFSFIPLQAREVVLPGGLTVPVTLEHALTEAQLAWGLMQRKSLPEESGMTFTYPQADYLHFWMFNCLIDISVAFLDERKIIREIFPMKAYPWKMDPLRPVRNVQEMNRYSINDPIARFFIAQGVVSTFPTRYALEMNLNWFTNHGVRPGDVVWWNNTPQGFVIRTIDMSPYLPLTEPLLLRFPDASFRSLRFPKGSGFYKVEFQDRDGKVLCRGVASPHYPIVCAQGVAVIAVNAL